ncbi:MAG: division/cell wall cluster transcriptional repressor MraZ [Anaerolineae bacterium]
MFYGEFLQDVDARGRLVIPQAFRADLANGLVITRGLDGCLLVYPASRWDEVADAVSRLPLTRSVARAFVRLLLGGASPQTLDTQGRFTLPVPLRRYARLDSSAVIVGTGDHIEIWGDTAWDRMTDDLAENGSEIAENLSNLGFALS